MSMNKAFTVKSAAFGGQTYNSTTGGPVGARFMHDAQPVKDRTGDDRLATAVVFPDEDFVMFIRMREIKWTLNIGTKGTLVLISEAKDGDVTMTCINMVYGGVNSNTDRGSMGEAELVFHHESADGTTSPMS